MSLKLSKSQSDVLNQLLDKYENSATYKGKNVRKQSFSIEPKSVFPAYNGDYTDKDEVDDFDREMKVLRDFQYIGLDYENNTPVIRKIKLNLAVIDEIYLLLHREDITVRRSRETEVYAQYFGIHQTLDTFCNAQIERLQNYKNAEYKLDDAKNILKLLKYLLTNDKDIVLRELSIAVLSDTKKFEKSYKTRICNILEKYGQLELDLSAFDDEKDEKEKEKAILEEYQVFSNPSYVFFKGNVEIYYRDGHVLTVTPHNPVAILSETIEKIQMVKIHSKRIITVENLTSYNRVEDSASTFIFLSGYHNTAKQRFLKKIAEYNCDVLWYHFGDIDPDGYYILKNLLEKTKIPFTPWHMDIEQLQKYRKYWKPLEKNDTVKAKSLINAYFYLEIMEFMVENNCKLEQEIISWLNADN